MAEYPARADRLDRLARIVTRAVGSPSAVVTVIEPEWQRFLGLAGLKESWTMDRGTRIECSLCQYPAATNEPLVLADVRAATHIPNAQEVADEGVLAYLGVPLRMQDGEVFGTLAAIDTAPREWTDDDLATVWDLAESAAAELGLDEMNRRLDQARRFSEAIVNTMRRPLVVVDHDLVIVAVNQSFERAFGVAAEDITSSSVSTISGGAWDMPAVTDALRGALASQRAVEGLEVRPEHPDLRGRVFQLNVRPLNWRDGPGPMLLVTFEDVTSMLRNQRERETFIDTVAHDLRNPVAAVRGEAQLLARRAQRGTLDAERIARGLSVIEDGTARMMRLIDDMVDTVYLSAGQRLKLRVEDVDLGDLARVTAASTPGSAGEAIEVDVREPVRVRADPARIRRVLDNLIGNAVKYSPAGGRIQVSVAAAEHGGRSGGLLSVRDEGIGIPAEDLPMLFDRFHRGRNVGAIEGNGLGLAGVRQLVEQHAGEITVASELGAGTTVTVWLPAVVGAELAATAD